MGGDGYALCLRAGAPLIDMEFVQFFPIGHLAPRLIGMDPIMWDPFRYKLGGRLLNNQGEEFTKNYGVPEAGKYVITRDVGTYAILKEVEAGRGSPHGGAYLSFQHVPARRAARGVRPGDRPARGQRHRSDQDAGRGRADRALPHGRRRGRRADADRSAGPAGRGRGGRRRQRRQPAFRQRHHRGAGVRPRGRPHRRRAREGGARRAATGRTPRAKRSTCCAANRARTRRTPPRCCRRCKPPWPTTSGRCAPKDKLQRALGRIDELDRDARRAPVRRRRSRSTSPGSTGSTCATC